MKRLITRSVAQETEDRMQNGRKRNPGGLNWSNQIVKPSFKILLGVKKIKSCRFRDLERSRVQFIINTQNSLSTSFFAWFETRCECDCDTAARRCALIWLLATGPRSVRVNHHLSRELGHFMAGLQLLHLSWSLLRKEKKKNRRMEDNSTKPVEESGLGRTGPPRQQVRHHRWIFVASSQRKDLKEPLQ